ncbi:hypothetical protein PR048_014616 [Dryococelus australis]|uniref:Uncharacterized protein n=1 Tax=Dryococelus australis TaxID=614101 RepID=A0ABQ9HEY0_9NEOP|nr:hypothetical protein PR048_014616 [Dryococelus australis]
MPLASPKSRQCVTCFKKISENSSTESFHEKFVPVEETASEANFSCEDLGVSPIIIKKLSHEKRSTLEKKVTRVVSVFREKFNASLNVACGPPCEEMDVQKPSEVAEYDILFNEVADKVKILSLVPQSWSIGKTCSEFQTSQYLVKNTRKLKKYRNLLHEAVVKITDFYENNIYSRICPGKKDLCRIKMKMEKKTRKD